MGRLPNGCRWNCTHRLGIFCPECHKIMELEDDRWVLLSGRSKLVCRDCGIEIIPNFGNLKKIGANFEMNAVETKAIDVSGGNRTTVKFSTIDYFPKLLKVEFGEVSFIVDRDDMKRMLEETQLLKED